MRSTLSVIAGAIVVTAIVLASGALTGGVDDGPLADGQRCLGDPQADAEPEYDIQEVCVATGSRAAAMSRRPALPETDLAYREDIAVSFRFYRGPGTDDVPDRHFAAVSRGNVDLAAGIGGGGGQWFGTCDSADDWGLRHLAETNTFVLSGDRSCWPEGQTTLDFSSFLNELGSEIDVRDEVDGTLFFVN